MGRWSGRRRRIPTFRAAAWLVAALLVAPVSAPAQPAFTKLTAAAGLAGSTYAAATGHSLGVNWIDYDRDGWPDLFAVGGSASRPPKLFHNLGDGTFADVSHLIPALPAVEMSGSVFGDLDNDGDPDIYIFTDDTSWGATASPDGPPKLLLRNLWVENGYQESTPLFQEEAAAWGLQDLPAVPFGPLGGNGSKTGGLVDYDRDGCLDVYVGHFVFGSVDDPGNRDALYRNECAPLENFRSYVDDTASSDVNPGTDPSTYRAALAFVAAHLDDDSDPDLYVVNASTDVHHDLVYTNDGDGTFTEQTALQVGLGDDSEAGMGIAVGDVNLDGHWDVYITDLFNTSGDALPKGNVLYLGNGDGTFQDNSAPGAGASASNSWGTVFFDVDQDGDEDLYVGTMAGVGADFLLINDGSGTFSDQAAGMGDTAGNRRGAAVADYDRDGDLDLAVVNHQGPLQLYRNDTLGAGSWVQFRLVGTAATTNRDAIGAIVRARVGADWQMRQLMGGSSAHSQNSLVVHMGFGPAVALLDEVEVTWPSGAVDLHYGVGTNVRHTLVEGQVLQPACADGVDNDGDGLADAADPGCGNPTRNEEDPACDDRRDNDGDSLVDLDDPHCATSYRLSERERCGLGIEIAPLLAAVWALRRRRVRRAREPRRA